MNQECCIKQSEQQHEETVSWRVLKNTKVGCLIYAIHLGL